MRIQVRKDNCLDYQGQAIILFHFSDARPLMGNTALLDWRCNASISALLKRKNDLFKFGQLTIVATQGKFPAETVILAGLGASGDLDGGLVREVCRLALSAALKVGAREVAVDGSFPPDVGKHLSTEAIKEVLGDIDQQGSLRISLFTGDEKQPSPSVGMSTAEDGVV
jgi:hypothetical protein